MLSALKLTRQNSSKNFTKKTITYAAARSIWTKVTATGHTIQECVKAATETLEHSSSASPASPDICVALVSKSFRLQHYHDLLKDLNDQLSQPKILIGGVIDRVPQFDHGISLLVGHNEKVVPFFIEDDKQRLKVRNISVGRWGRVDDKERIEYQNNYIDTKGWDKLGLISTAVQDYDLPEGFNMEERVQEQPSFIFTLSDNEPDQLLQTFDHHYPSVPKVGIVGASTPFITGLPYTLFKSAEEVVGSGIVGFASYNSNSEVKDIRMDYTAMEKLGNPMKITRCQGNVILDVDQGGPTGLLLRLIQKRPKISKDEEFYLGVYPPHVSDTTTASLNDMTVSKITSGDPGRGSMSIDTTVTLQSGQMIQFFTKKSFEFTNVSSVPVQKNELVLGVSGKDFTIDARIVEIPKEPKALTDVFGAVSENGIIVGRKSMPAQLLDVPYSRLFFKL